MKYKMLGENAHKALADITKEKLSPIRTAFHDVCKEEVSSKLKERKKCNWNSRIHYTKLERRIQKTGPMAGMPYHVPVK